MEEIVRRIGLNPEEERGVLAKAPLKKFEGLFPVAELRIEKRQVNRRDVP